MDIEIPGEEKNKIIRNKREKKKYKETEMLSGNISGLMDFKSNLRNWRINSSAKKEDLNNLSSIGSNVYLSPSCIKHAANIALSTKKS